jgi:hypothetical protein
MALSQLIPCGYCFQRWADCRDHILPKSAGGGSDSNNLYPTCDRCNALLGAKIFGSLDEKREYVRTILKRRGIWNQPEEVLYMRQRVLAQAELAKILHRPLSVDQMGRESSQNKQEEWMKQAVSDPLTPQWMLKVLRHWVSG